MNAFTLWSPENGRVVKGAEHLKQYNKTENSDRKWCDLCGGHDMAGHPGLKLIDVYSVVIPDVKFTPGLHANYAETVLPMKDALSKMKDFPADFGGSGITVPE